MTLAFPIKAKAADADLRHAHAAATGLVAVLLRAEACVELALAVATYRYLGGSWMMFAGLFLAPDLAMAGYSVDRRIGAQFYNMAHTYLAPALLAVAGLMLGAPLLTSLAMIWAAHIGFDRLIGFGLKYPVAFGATHLGWHDPHAEA